MLNSGEPAKNRKNYSAWLWVVMVGYGISAAGTFILPKYYTTFLCLLSFFSGLGIWMAYQIQRTRPDAYEVFSRAAALIKQRLTGASGASFTEEELGVLAVVVNDMLGTLARQERELKECRQQFQDIFYNSPDAYFIQDNQGIILDANPAASLLLGKPHEQLLGKSIADTAFPGQRKKVAAQLAEIAAGKLPSFESVLTRVDNALVPVEVRGNANSHLGQPAVLLQIIDITKRKQAEESRGRLEVQLRQVQKMEAIGTLAGGIAHDFNNILAIIMPYCTMVQRQCQDRPQVLEYLDHIQKASERARNLVQQILTFSRKSRQERTNLRVQPIIKESLRFLRSAIPTTIEMVSEIDETVPPIVSDPTQVHQVLMNLCSNAEFAMRNRSGVLKVSLTEAVLDETGLTNFPKSSPGNFAKLSVSDTGAGMDEDTLKRVFEPFFTTKALGEGTGLGLAVVHTIVKDHRGSIQVSSKPGSGTVFHIYFPLAKEPQLPQSAFVPAIVPGHGEHILFVDDEKDVTSLVGQILVQLGYQVSAFNDPVAALKAFEASPRNFALLFTDLTMPGLTGIQLINKMRALRADIPVILATGFGEDKTQQAIKETGIKYVVTKPLTVMMYADLLQKALKDTSISTKTSTSA
jgi:PAS domain S-box-containing protein